MSDVRVSLYERLPEIYRTKDAEQQYQLKGYLSLVEEMFSGIHRNIEELYGDLFIETCAEWVIPYIGDLLGVSRLKGDPWTIRADVAQTIRLRRRKGTIRAIELLTYNLSGWGVHCVELRDRLVWNQHLNHQRPDAGGEPPYGDDSSGKYLADQTHRMIPRGGTMPVRHGAYHFLLEGPFDPFAHTVDVKPASFGQLRYNIPNLAIYFTRCRDYQVKAIKAAYEKTIDISEAGAAPKVVCFYADPLKRPMRLFNNGKFNFDEHTKERSDIESMPGPMPLVFSPGGELFAGSDDFCFIDSYDAVSKSFLDVALKAFGVHIPKELFVVAPGMDDTGDQVDDQAVAGEWSFRAANLCCWSDSLIKPLKNREIAVDPCSGRFMAGVADAAEATALQNHLRVTYTYGALGPIGAHPISRGSAPQKWYGQDVQKVLVPSEKTLESAIMDAMGQSKPVVIEIEDSEVHSVDLSEVKLNNSLILRAAGSVRPVILLKKPLKFRPNHIPAPGSGGYEYIETLSVVLEGLFITRDAGVNELIAQAAVHRLEVKDSTLDPGGYEQDDGSPAPLYASMILGSDYALTGSTEQDNFDEIPEIVLENSVTGALKIDKNYTLDIGNSIIDAGGSAAIDPVSDDNGPGLKISGATIFGSTRVESVYAEGVIFRETLYVHNNQKGCVKFSYLSGNGDRLPQNHACVKGKGDPQKDARLVFNSENFGRHTYGQLHYGSDRRIREEGPGRDAMGATGFLKETHKLQNINIRYREFIPAGTRALLIPADHLDSCDKRRKL